MDLTKMKLHDFTTVLIDGQQVKIIKVLGGWIYNIGSPENFTSTFVPMSIHALEDHAKQQPPATGLGGVVVK